MHLPQLIIKNILPMAMLSLLFFPSAFGNAENEPINEEYDSLYKYNALESRVSFFDLANNNANSSDSLNGDSLANEESSVLINQKSKEELVEEEVKEEFQNLTEKINYSMGRIETAVKALENKNRLGTFLIGNNLGILKFQLVQIKDQVYLLETLNKKTENDDLKIKIDKQVKLLQEEQERVVNFILERESKFSLFGWFRTVL